MTTIIVIRVPTISKGVSSPCLNISVTCTAVLGNWATIPANISNDIPLPIPFSDILSPIQTRNIVPATSVVTAMKINPNPLFGTTGIPAGDT